MFASIAKASRIVFDPAFVGIVWKSLALTLGLFVVLFVGAEWLVVHLPALRWHWMNVALEVLTPVLFILLLFAAGAPVAAIFGSLFLDTIADAVEARDYANDPKAAGISFWAGLVAGLRLAFWIVVLNLLLLPFQILLPVIGTALTFVLDGWLLGREFFELAALRHLPRREADAMRRRHRGGILGAGLVISLLAFVPIVNLIAPLFGAALMVHLFKCYERADRGAAV
ncbi:MAG TPA: EI24 domain-containing protein [Rhizomicrobium sp.]|nr:EI24 domain-containing protein [Rhizomicrobium sp.]